MPALLVVWSFKMLVLLQEIMSRIDSACSGHCKSVVRRIIEQVRVETEQWSQMQEMLGQVRNEMEELQALRDFWEDQALKSDVQMQSLCSAVRILCTDPRVLFSPGRFSCSSH